MLLHNKYSLITSELSGDALAAESTRSQHSTPLEVVFYLLISLIYILVFHTLIEAQSESQLTP